MDRKKDLNQLVFPKPGERYTFRKLPPKGTGDTRQPRSVPGTRSAYGAGQSAYIERSSEIAPPPTEEVAVTIDQPSASESPGFQTQFGRTVITADERKKRQATVTSRSGFRKQALGVVESRATKNSTPAHQQASTEMSPVKQLQEPLTDVGAEEKNLNRLTASRASFRKQLHGTVKTDKQQKKAYTGFWMRFWAFTIDIMVVGFISNIFITPVFLIFDISFAEQTRFSPFSVVTQVIFFSYFVLMTKFFQATLGKMILGLKVVSVETDRLTWGSTIFRELVGRYIVSVFWFMKLTYLLVAFLPKKQGLHDLFADTAVVFEKR